MKRYTLSVNLEHVTKCEPLSMRWAEITYMNPDEMRADRDKLRDAGINTLCHVEERKKEVFV